MTAIVNFLLYQIGWFCCVMGAAWDVPWIGMCLASCRVGIHFWLARDRATQVQLALVAAAIGISIDTLQLWIGVFVFPHGIIVEWLPPPWMSILWIQFATTFQYSMRWLSGHYLMSAGFGIAGAPLAFFAGERLGAIEFLPPRLDHYVVLALLWSITVPLLVYISDYLAAHSQVAATYRWLSPPRASSKFHRPCRSKSSSNTAT